MKFQTAIVNKKENVKLAPCGHFSKMYTSNKKESNIRYQSEGKFYEDDGKFKPPKIGMKPLYIIN